MKKQRINITIDQDIDLWIRTTLVNRSEIINDFLRHFMETKNRQSVDEQELQSEIEYHEEKINHHRSDLIAKRAELARLHHERTEAEKEKRERQRKASLSMKASSANAEVRLH
jgi:metal-responsive CopG/Arc/MetJ family transcriptional regulator